MAISYRFNTILRFTQASLLGLAALVLAEPAQGDPADHDRALQAVRQGEALSLQGLMERVPALRNGHVLEVELERKQGRWVYEIKSLEPGGRLVKRKLDAQSGEILHTKENKEKAKP